MSLQLVHSIAELRDTLSRMRRAGATIGLVPTMGALHAGHGRLIEQARRESGCVVVSIFVNPIQFDQKDDYTRYPRTLSTDLEFCQARSVDVVFAPAVEEIYPHPQRTFVEVTGVTEHLCGQFRPGHFRGVATVVLKLFNIVQPDRAYFGEKDAQQLAVIRHMVRELNLPVTIVEVATVREADGLALSSRNQRLSPEQRRAATRLFQALQVAEKRIASGASSPDEIKREALAILQQQPQLRVEYLEIVDPDEMQPVDRIAGPVRVAAAVWIGSTRLIDNLLCKPV
jgi:pantoate--beta-alanine ligase